MTTSDPLAADVPDVRQLETLSAVAAGLPDPATLSRWANAFLQGLSAPDVVPAAPAGVGSLSLPSAATVPDEAALRALPGTLGAGSTAIPAQVPAAPVEAVRVPAVPGIPGGLSAANLSTEPDLGFLRELRPLFSGAPALPVHALPLPATSLPVDPQLRDLTAGVPGTQVPPVPATTGELASPQVPGTVVRGAPPATNNFLQDLTPIAAASGVPVLVPAVPTTTVPTVDRLSADGFDVAAVRRDFPILAEQVNGRPLVWLDNAATTQKPQAVIDRLAYFYQHENSNIHRAAHTLAARSTDAYEAAREKVRRFLNAGSAQEIIFVRGATEGINLVAQSWGRRFVGKDDEIVVTHLEHHANIVPWQQLAAEKGARLRVAPVDDSGQIILDEYEKLLNPRTRLVSLTQVSNALGTVTPVAAMVAAAHRHGAKVLVDGAQAVSHLRVDVQAFDADFYVFSGHKVFAPTGIGVVYGKEDVLAVTPPWQGGGNMIADVTFEKTIYHPPPSRFEAGTGNIADAVGLGAAIDYLDRIGMANISRYEHDLLVYGTEQLKRVPGLRLIGTAAEKASVLSFVLDGWTTQQVGEHLSREGIAVRSGHHCAQPILRRFGLESTVRPSLAFYNTCEEIDALIAALWNLKQGRGPGL